MDFPQPFVDATLKWITTKGPIPWTGLEMTRSHQQVLLTLKEQKLVEIEPGPDGELEVRAPGPRINRRLTVLNNLPARAVYLVPNAEIANECRAFIRERNIRDIAVMTGDADSSSTVWKYTRRMKRPLYLSPDFMQSAVNALTLREHNARFGLDQPLPDENGDLLPVETLRRWPFRPLRPLEEKIAAMGGSVR